MSQRTRSLGNAKAVLYEALQSRGESELAECANDSPFWDVVMDPDNQSTEYLSCLIALPDQTFLLVGSDLTGDGAADDDCFLIAVYPGTDIGDSTEALAMVASDDPQWFEQAPA